MPCEGLDRSVFKQKIFLKKPSLTSQLMSKLFQDLNPSTQSMILVLQKLSSDDQPFNSNGRKGGRFQLQRLAAVQLPVEETEPNQLSFTRRFHAPQTKRPGHRRL